MFKQLPRLQEMWDGFDSGGWSEPVAPWQEWFAWRPVKVQGKCVWLKRVYRRCINTYVDFDDWKRYEYGNIFDVLSNNEKPANVGQVPPKPAPQAGTIFKLKWPTK